MLITLLEEDLILRVHEAAVGLALDRETLVSGLPPHVRRSLSTTRTEAGQIRSDLHELNRIERLEGGNVPLVSWVNAALALSPKRAERDVFLEAQRALGGSTPSPALDIDASAWLRRVEEETQWADLLGLTTSNDALRVRLEQVFMPPSAHLHGDRAPSGELDDPPMSMPLTEAMSAHPFLIIIGEPGSGKTTLLRHVAHHLARAAQGQKGSRAVLGLPRSGDVALPLLIPLQHLATFLVDRGDHP